MKKDSLRAKMSFIMAMTIFGTLGLFIKDIHLSSALIAEVRGILGTLFLLFVVLCKGSKLSFENIKRNQKYLVLAGAAIGANWILLFEAYRYTTVSAATLSYYMAPVFVMILAPLVVKEPLNARKGIAIALAFLGMILVSGLLGEEVSGFTGILYGLGAASFYAMVVLLNQFLDSISAYDITITQLSIATIVLFPYILLTEDFSAITMSTMDIGLLLIVGIFHTGFTYALYFGSLQHLKAQTAAIFSYIDPIVAVLLSALWLKEPMTVYQMIGAVLILGATFWSSLSKSES